MKHAAFIVMIVGAGLTVTAVSADARNSKGPMPSFTELDLNNDGSLTLEEMQGYRASRFDAADTNGDGLLQAEEMISAAEARVEKRVEAMLERFDTDKDGALSRDEMPAAGERHAKRSERMFERADADGNGAISEEEFKSAQAKMKRHGKGHGKGHGSDQDRQSN